MRTPAKILTRDLGKKRKPAEFQRVFLCSGGEGGIRTPGGVTLNGFQDRRNRPLCHLSFEFAGAKLIHFFFCSKYFGTFYLFF